MVLLNDRHMHLALQHHKIKARQTIVNETKAGKICEILKILSDPTRIKIVTAISSNELCVCEIALALDLSRL